MEKSKVQEEVDRLLSKYQREFPPVDVLKIAKNEGISVISGKFPEGFSDVLGFYEHSEDTIYINQNTSPLAQNFTIAHELAHAKLHRDYSKSDNYQVSLSRPSDTDHSNSQFEQEAFDFAYSILMPQKFLDRIPLSFFSDKTFLEKMSTVFVVSDHVVKSRLKHLYGIS